MPVSQATCVSRMEEAREPRGLSRGLRAYLQWEYGEDARFVGAQLARSNGAKASHKRPGFGRAVVRALAKIPETFAAAFGTPEGA